MLRGGLPHEKSERMDASTETEPSSQPQPATDLHDDDAAEAASKPQETVSAVSATKKPASAGNSAMPLQRKSRVQKVTVSENKTYNIIVITEPRAKPFLGGWRHKTTGVEYVNASTQTPRAVRPNNKERYTRNTQTAIVRSEPKFATQTAVDTATQMTKDGVYITDSTDIVRLPGQYETADEREFRITQKVGWWAGWRCRTVPSFVNNRKTKRAGKARSEPGRRYTTGTGGHSVLKGFAFHF